jgi:hypothetical protein
VRVKALRCPRMRWTAVGEAPVRIRPARGKVTEDVDPDVREAEINQRRLPDRAHEVPESERPHPKNDANSIIASAIVNASLKPTPLP